jgi:hypothetical protein
MQVQMNSIERLVYYASELPLEENRERVHHEIAFPTKGQVEFAKLSVSVLEYAIDFNSVVSYAKRNVSIKQCIVQDMPWSTCGRCWSNRFAT